MNVALAGSRLVQVPPNLKQKTEEKFLRFFINPLGGWGRNARNKKPPAMPVEDKIL